MSMEPVAWLVKTRMGNIAWATWQPAGEPLVRLSDAEARIAELEEEVGRLEDENSDLRYEPWPEWARAVLKVIRKHSGYDGYDDATEGVDMPLELSEHLSEMEAEAGRWKARAEAAEALLKEAGKALAPFARYKTADGVVGMDGKEHLRIQDGHVLMCNMKSMADWAAIDPSTVITVGDFRAARSISAKIGESTE